MGSCCCLLRLQLRRRRRPCLICSSLLWRLALRLADLLGTARHGGQRRRPLRRRDPPVCVGRRVLGGFGGRPLGRAQFVRSCLYLATCLAGVWVLDGWPGASCWWRPRRMRPRCYGTGGRRRVGGWAFGNAVRSRFVVVVVVADVCVCRPAGLCLNLVLYVCSRVAGGVRCMGSCCCSLRLRRRRRRRFFVCNVACGD
jgi:hypothetical protein